MLKEIAMQMGLTDCGNDEFKTDGGLSIQFSEKEAVITERLELENEYNKITALTYAMGEMENSYLSTDGRGLFFVPESMKERRLKIVVVHVYAPDVCVVRPIRVVNNIQYQPGMSSPEDLIQEKIAEIARSRFSSPEIKMLVQNEKVLVYTATSFDKGCPLKEGESKESMVSMFAREAKNELEATIIGELKKIYQASDPQQVYNTLLHEENHPADRPDV